MNLPITKALYTATEILILIGVAVALLQIGTFTFAIGTDAETSLAIKPFVLGVVGALMTVALLIGITGIGSNIAYEYEIKKWKEKRQAESK